MKIAVVGPSPIPFTIGGAENLTTGLYDSINKCTEHQAELIKVPVKETNFWEVMDAYYKFYTLDLSHFDMVITLKYPSWMVRHPNSICWVMHTLRGLYDTYFMTGLSEVVEKGCPAVDNIVKYMEENPEPKDLDKFFAMVFALKINKNIPEKYFDFPAPFIRLLVHYMDSFGLKNQKKYFTLSNTVKNRKDYFPKDALVNVIYPPSVLKECKCGEYEYVFMASRLDGAKRIDMLIKAFKYVKSDIRLLIAGSGPEKERLVSLASGDKRVKFLGFVRDDELEEYYADCLVVPYFPYDEDYGYITAEAMARKKPVITTDDAGGPTEFVQDGVTGFVVPFEEKAIAAKIDFYAQNPDAAKKHGEAAFEKVNNIQWPRAVSILFDSEFADNDNLEKRAAAPRKKMTVTSTFKIYPVQGGGQARIFGIYSNFARQFDCDVEIVSFCGVNEKRFERHIAPYVYENRFPKSQAQQEKEWSLSGKAQFDVADIAMIPYAKESGDYICALRKSISQSDFVVVSHPYLYPAAKEFLEGKDFIYEAHNVESLMKKGMLPESPVKEELLRLVFDAEKECAQKAKFIMTCSQEDKDTLAQLYGLDKNKIFVVPNGVDTAQTEFVTIEKRLANKKRLGLENETLGLFMGSWHGPNLDACEEILKIAELCPDAKFLLMGSQCWYFKERVLPKNVVLLGLVSDEEKAKVFSCADFALNPMMGGSGTNLKMFDYMSAGLPIITTKFGARGIENKDVFIIAETDEMAKAVLEFDLKKQDALVHAARKYAEETFDWKVIVKAMEGMI